MKRRLTSLLLAVLLLLPMLAMPVSAASDWQTSIQYYQSAVPSPGYGAEWGVIASCATGGSNAYGSKYWANIQTAVKDAKGVLDSRKSTELTRVILAITATGNNAAKVSGYDLTAQLTDTEYITKQGVNGAIFALLALDSGSYKSTMRDKLVQYILDAQLDDGGWVLSGQYSDTDVTAMALQALAPYLSRSDVRTAIAEGLTRLSAMQKPSGGFASYGSENCESSAQVILALCQLGIALDDPRFVKGGKTALDAMQTYRNKDGSYRHLADGDVTEIATCQAAMALIALNQRSKGLPGIYTMTPTFSDLSKHWAGGYVQDAVHRGIFVAADAVSGSNFNPDAAMSRTDVIKALWRTKSAPKVDVSKADSSWKQHPHMVWAQQQGIIDTFDPNGTLTRAQLCTMLWRMSGEPAATAASKTGKTYGLSDLSTTPGWADSAMGWALKVGLIKGDNGKLAPNNNVTRAQAATILLRYLEEIS